MISESIVSIKLDTNSSEFKKNGLTQSNQLVVGLDDNKKHFNFKDDKRVLSTKIISEYKVFSNIAGQINEHNKMHALDKLCNFLGLRYEHYKIFPDKILVDPKKNFELKYENKFSLYNHIKKCNRYINSVNLNVTQSDKVAKKLHLETSYILMGFENGGELDFSFSINQSFNEPKIEIPDHIAEVAHSFLFLIAHRDEKEHKYGDFPRRIGILKNYLKSELKKQINDIDGNDSEAPIQYKKHQNIKKYQESYEQQNNQLYDQGTFINDKSKNNNTELQKFEENKKISGKL